MKKIIEFISMNIIILLSFSAFCQESYKSKIPKISDLPSLSIPNEIKFKETIDSYGRKQLNGTDFKTNLMYTQYYYYENKPSKCEVLNLNNGKSISYDLPSGKIIEIGQYKLDREYKIWIHTGEFFNFNKKGDLESMTKYNSENTYRKSNNREHYSFYTDFVDEKYIGKVHFITYYDDEGYQYYHAEYEIDSLYTNKYPYQFLESCYFLSKEKKTNGNIVEETFYYSPCKIDRNRKNKNNKNRVMTQYYSSKSSPKNIKRIDYDFETGKATTEYINN